MFDGIISALSGVANEVVSSLFQFILDSIGLFIRIICFPINAILNQVFTNSNIDFSSWIDYIYEGFDTIFTYINWVVGMLPPSLVTVLIFILTVEIAKLVIYYSTQAIIRVFKIVQKIKLW